MAVNKKIPLFNDSFDMSKLTHVLKKNFLYYILFVIITITSTYLYLRYTPPTYETHSVIQVNESKNSQFLEVENVYGQTSLTNLIELIRSREFLKRTLTKLNLNTCYYLEGKFLTTEFYQNSPFFVESKDFPSEYNNKKIYTTYNAKEDLVYLDIELSEDNYVTYKVKRNTWVPIKTGKIYINITNGDNFKTHTDKFQSNKIYFTIFDDQGAFAKHLSTLNVSILNKEAGTITLNYIGNNAKKATDIVNTISNDFLTYNVEKKQERATKILQFVDDELNSVYKKLDEAEKQLKKYGINLKEGEEITVDAKNISSLFNNKGTDTETYTRKLGFLNLISSQIQESGNLNTMDLIKLLSNQSSNETMIVSFLQGIQQLEEEKEALLVNVTEDNQKVVKINQQIKEQTDLLLEITNMTISEINETLDKSKIKTKVNEKKIDLTEGKEIELTKIRRMYDLNQTYYNQLVEKFAQYTISKAGHVTENVILQKSDIPGQPIAPIKSYVIFISSVLCFLSIFILTLIRYMLFNHIMSINDISRFTEVPVGGVIPVSKNTNKINRFVVENKANSVITEAFRTLRSNLEFMHQNKDDKKIIAITSTISGEGKTFIAINLGGVFSLSGKRVILLDLDLRKPKVHLTFKSTNDRGLSTILIGKDNYKDCIIETEFENFNIITSGPPPPNPAELANSDAFDNLLADLKKEYDVIIVDTPPIGIVSDAIFSFKRADLPIYVTRANYSKRNFINNINYVREHKKISNISLVLNAVEIVSSKYGYGYKGYGYGGYGYGYGYGFGYGYYSYGEEKKKQKKKPKGLAKFLKK